MLRGVGAALLATTALAAPAWAYVKAGSTVMPGVHNVLRGATVQDGMATSLSAAYSFRKVRDAYAGSAVKLRRTTGGTQDIGFTAAGDFDTAAATTFCLATTCFIDTWYDQSGNVRHAVQAVAANQLSFVFDCTGTLPCARALGVIHQNAAASASVTPSATVSLSAVGNRGSFGGASPECYWIAQNGTGGNKLVTLANSWYLAASGAIQATPTPADNAWHVHQGIIAGASSVYGVDGVETTGSVATVAGAAVPFIGTAGSLGTVCSFVEALVWDNYALTAGERQALTENQRNYWAPLPLDSFATPAAAYSMRRLKSSYTGPGIRLRRASDNAEADIPFLGYTSFTGAPIDAAAAASHCTSACGIAVWYDQSGNARHMLQATAGSQPQYIAACKGSLPCARETVTAQNMSVAGVSPATVISLNAVASHAVRPGGCVYISVNFNNNLYQDPTADVLHLQGTGGINAPAAGLAWHSHTGVINGAASVANIDGAETTGTVTVTAGAGPLFFSPQAAGATCENAEMIWWDGYALTAGERTALQTNQKNFWGTP